MEFDTIPRPSVTTTRQEGRRLGDRRHSLVPAFRASTVATYEQFRNELPYEG
jgi:hypothetical protein